MTAPLPPICACDGGAAFAPSNLQALAQVAARAGTFRGFRRALLTPLHGDPGAPQLEWALAPWRAGIGATPAVPDLGVMTVEWWAYLADILCFYNERIANEGYLRTTQLPESAGRLVALLGYRPRPAIGSTGTLAALVTPGTSATLPVGLQFQSKPGPGQEPQTFELDQATPIAAPDVVPANPGSPNLLARTTVRVPYSMPPWVLQHLGQKAPTPPPAVDESMLGYDVRVQGRVASVIVGTPLLLGSRDGAAAPVLATVHAVSVPGGAAPMTLSLLLSGAAPALTVATGRLQRASQSIGLWTINDSAIDLQVLQLAGLARSIGAGDWIVLSRTNATCLVQVSSSQDRLGDASVDGSAIKVTVSAAGQPTPIPVLHTELHFDTPLDFQFASGAVSVLFGWVDLPGLLDAPAQLWDGQSTTTLTATAPAVFVDGSEVPILVQDATGTGVLATATSGGDGFLAVSPSALMPAPFSPMLQPPLQVLYNPLPVSRGKTVAKEVLGSGDATIAGQSFALAKSPVTYLDHGDSYASTIALIVGGLPWKEVASFFDQAPDARVFVTREDDQGITHVDFGDGVNGARLPTGADNVVATYRIGAGLASPPAGKLTVIAQAYPGLRAVLNPVAVGGGADADLPAFLQQDAPRSVLTFGRAVSIYDYQAIAAGASGVTRARALWGWDDVAQRTCVLVYVAGTGDVRTQAKKKLSAQGDPNRPVVVNVATARATMFSATLVATPGRDFDVIAHAVRAALADPDSGLFSPSRLTIGQALFDSQVEAACLAVEGVVAIQSFTLNVDGAPSRGPLHPPGDTSYFALAPVDVELVIEADPNG